MHKLVNENLFEFKKGLDPVESLGLGRRKLIKDWLDLYHIENYTINDDYTIDVDDDVEIVRAELKELPEFIQFGIVEGNFFVWGNKLTSLRGCPRIVNFSFSCRENKLTSLAGCPEKVKANFFCWGNPGNFTINDINKICSVRGKIKNDK